MSDFSPSFTDTSSWEMIKYTATGGSRSKVITKNEQGDSYFFKGSKTLEDGSVRYRHEFWSEIAASKIGKYLGFNILDYNIGYNSDFPQGIGCLSRSMVEHSQNALSEGKDYLSGFDTSYNPVKDENRYTFDFIKASIEDFELESEIPKLVETMIFDALIGNSDRHQENWGFIIKYTEILDDIDKSIEKSIWPVRWLLRIFHWSLTQSSKYFENVRGAGLKKLREALLRQSQFTPTQFSPIYDSGCCLGRELEDSKIEEMLSNHQQIEKYVERGRSEVRLFEGKKKPKHFEVVQYLLEHHEKETKVVLTRISELYKKEMVTEIVSLLDAKLPDHLSEYKLPEDRKTLMVNLIDLRFQRLVSIK